MPDYRVVFKSSARRELEKLEAPVVNRIMPGLRDLAREPRPANCRKLRGADNLWRIRIGDYRVIYAIHEDEQLVRIMAVRHRRESYR